MLKTSGLLPVSALFILLLIIGGNYLGILFPCQLQDILENNILVKHFLAFLTLIFFAVLADPGNEKPLKDILKQSILLYFWFILIIRMNAKFFLALVFIIALIYILKLYKKGARPSTRACPLYYLTAAVFSHRGTTAQHPGFPTTRHHLRQ